MKQNSNRRSRSRNSNKKTHGKNSYESNGPAGRVRGTAQQVLEKYQVLGRDAASSGDWIVAESCLQYAEYYYRIVNAEIEANGKSQEIQNNNSDQLHQEATIKITTEIPKSDSSVDGLGVQETPSSLHAVELNEELKGDDLSGQKEVQEDSRGDLTNRNSRRRRSRGKVENPSSTISRGPEV